MGAEDPQPDGGDGGARLGSVEWSVPGRPRYAQIVQGGNQGIWVFALDGATVYANDTFAEMVGYTPGEIGCLSLIDVLDDVGKIQGADFLARQRATGGTTESVECLLVRRDGTSLWTLVSHSPWRDEDGRHRGVIAFVSDITDRRRLNEELQRSKDQLAEAQRVSHLGSWEWEIASDQLRWSDELFRIFGVSPGEFDPTFQGYLGLVHPDDRQLTADRVSACLNGERRFELDQRVLRGEGPCVWVRASGELIVDTHGSPLLMRGTALNITAFKEAEGALQRTTSRYQLLQRMASTANGAKGLAEAAELAVQELCAHLGWPAGRAYLASTDPPRLSPGRTDRAPSGVAVEACALGRPRWASSEHADADPARTPGAGGTVFAYPVVADETVVAVLEFAAVQPVDIAEAVELCEQVGTQLARVAERERASRELTRARDTAVEASRVKSEFLAMMSHEIRTPMNGVIGLTELLLETQLDGWQRQYAEGIQGAGEALLTIINDILDFSKMEAGKLELESIDFDVGRVVEEVAGLVARQARAKGLELRTDSDLGPAVALRGDPARLRQVLLNLAWNAIKFTATGVVTLRARLLDETDTAVDVCFEVVDTGMGISPEDQSRLFEAFSQMDASTTRRFGGTGLGLAISKQLVEAMGGRLSVVSAVGNGSTFAFTLRLARGVAGAGAPSGR